jgi:hypothetical protein
MNALDRLYDAQGRSKELAALLGKRLESALDDAGILKDVEGAALAKR